MKHLAVAATAAACLLVWAGAADAKVLRSVSACGAAGCRSVVEPALLRQLMLESRDGPVTGALPVPARFFRIDFAFRGDRSPGPTFSQYYVPGHGAAAAETDPGRWTWMRVSPRLVRLYDRIIAGTEPFAAPTITGARVNGRKVAGAASYAALLTIEGAAGHPNMSEPDWITIELSSPQASPWTTGRTLLEYSPSAHLLWRGNEFVRLPDAVASAIEDRRPLRLRAEAAGFPWLALPGALGVAALAGVGVVALRRRRPHTGS